MYRIIFKLCIVFAIVSPSLPAQNNYRRYNVDQESVKLYGEDFKSVLKRFRRTPDYLKILQDKLGDLKTSAKEMSLQILHYYHGKLEERVNEVLPAPTTVAGTRQSRRRKIYKTLPADTIIMRGQSNRRQGGPETEPVDDSLQNIQNLDNYKVFESQLSVAERNSLKDLGFEYAGKIIHTIITNMGPKPEPGEKEQQYTHVPEDLSHENKKEETTTTTTHPPEHVEPPKEDDAKTVPDDAKTVPDDAKTVPDDTTVKEEDSLSTQGVIIENDPTRSKKKSKISALEF